MSPAADTFPRSPARPQTIQAFRPHPRPPSPADLSPLPARAKSPPQLFDLNPPTESPLHSSLHPHNSTIRSTTVAPSQAQLFGPVQSAAAKTAPPHSKIRRADRSGKFRFGRFVQME